MRRKPAFVPGALSLTEQGVHLLRRNGASALLEYYIGSLPFYLALLYFWSDMSRNPYAGLYCAPAAAGLALLFIWMKLWHVRYCRRLWCILQDTESEAWPLRRLLSTAARQALIQSTGWVVQPLAILILLPLAWTTAFYQNASIMDGPEALNFKSVYKNAVHQAALWSGQNHLILCILSAFGMIVFFNVVVGLMLAPYLLKTLFGIETVFTVSGFHAMTNTTFLAIVCTLTWLLIDPLIKAVYTLRCFHGFSQQTGDDIRTRLKPFIRIAAFLILYVLMPWQPGLQAAETALPVNGTPVVEDGRAIVEQLNRSIDNVLQKRHFAWRLPREKKVETESEKESNWLKTALKWMMEKLSKMGNAIAEWIESIDEWLRKKFPEKEYGSESRRDFDAMVKITMFILAGGLALLLLLFLAGCLKNIRNRKDSGPVAAEIRIIDLNDENVFADELPHRKWLDLALASMEQKDLRQAIRALYLAILAQLGEHRRIKIARYKSNFDYYRELSRRVHAEPELLTAFEQCIQMFETIWYGLYPVETALLTRFKACQERISAIVQQQA